MRLGVPCVLRVRCHPGVCAEVVSLLLLVVSLLTACSFTLILFAGSLVRTMMSLLSKMESAGVRSCKCMVSWALFPKFTTTNRTTQATDAEDHLSNSLMRFRRTSFSYRRASFFAHSARYLALYLSARQCASNSRRMCDLPLRSFSLGRGVETFESEC